MCEMCVKIRDASLEQIRDLLEFKDGPVSMKVKEGMAHVERENADKIQDPELDLDLFLLSVRMQLISQRAAMVAITCDGPDRGLHPAKIFSRWALDALGGIVPLPGDPEFDDDDVAAYTEERKQMVENAEATLEEAAKKIFGPDAQVNIMSFDELRNQVMKDSMPPLPEIRRMPKRREFDD